MGLFSKSKELSEQDKGLQELTLSLNLSDFLPLNGSNKTITTNIRMLDEIGKGLSNIKDKQELEVYTQSHSILRIKRVRGKLVILD